MAEPLPAHEEKYVRIYVESVSGANVRAFKKVETNAPINCIAQKSMLY
jgi:hypothetical protein